MDFVGIAKTRRAAMEFLLAHGFSVDNMCNFGVRYLSRLEEETAIQRAIEKCRSPSPVPQLNIQENDVECLEFLQSARAAINEWLGQGEVST